MGMCTYTHKLNIILQIPAHCERKFIHYANPRRACHRETTMTMYHSTNGLSRSMFIGSSKRYLTNNNYDKQIQSKKFKIMSIYKKYTNILHFLLK